MLYSTESPTSYASSSRCIKDNIFAICLSLEVFKNSGQLAYHFPARRFEIRIQDISVSVAQISRLNELNFCDAPFPVLIGNQKMRQLNN